MRFSGDSSSSSFLSVVFLVFVASDVVVSALENPYKTLAVKRSATAAEIKRAYKHLVKEWHPDKNKNAGAEAKFIEINEAYELLSDPERRREYDQHGITDDAHHTRQKPDYSSFRRFETFFGSDGFHFNFDFNEGSIYHKRSITYKAFDSNIVANSNRTPYLILFYSDWCLACMQLEPVWKRIVEELDHVGMGVATIHAEHERLLVKKLGISSLPYLILVIDGRVVYYRDSQISVNKVVEFSKRKFPSKLIVSLNTANIDDFLSAWIYDNRVRILFFGRQESIRLRYYLLAFYHRDRAAAGYVPLNSVDTEKIRTRFGVSSNSESLLVFNENSDLPVASLSMPDIPTATMHDVINANKFLILPRLSSQAMFDQLCPPEASRSRKRLCVILVTANKPEHEAYRSAMREYIHQFAPKSDRVHFAYIFEEKQSSFVNALNQGENSPDVTTLHVVIIWRRDFKNLKYEWLESDWTIDVEKINETQEMLRSTIQRLLHSKEVLSYDAIVQELVDEHAQSIFMRILMKLFFLVEFLQDNITRDEALPVISVLCTVALIVGGGYVMSYLVKLEEESIKRRYRAEGKEFPSGKKSSKAESGRARGQENQLRIHELKGETYNALIRLLKPGCRTILLLVDEDSKSVLVPKFHKIVYPYRKNKTLMFAYLMLEKYLEWYKRLLMQTLPEPRLLDINPKNCIGTVLSLNGLRHYFCMYHAKHQENYRGQADKGGFLGFEDSSASETSDVEANPTEEMNSILRQENLLDGLSNWLDRLFEGTTQRYYIQFWPILK